MPFGLTVEVTSLLLLDFEEIVEESFDRALLETTTYLRNNSPIGVSPRRPGLALAESWEHRIGRVGGETEGEVLNTVPNSNARLFGRGPGVVPEVGRGSPLYDWSIIKAKLPPKAVAFSIARRGTERWRKKIDPTKGFERIFIEELISELTARVGN